MIDYRWTTSVLGISFAIIVLWLVRQDRLHSKYAIWWLPIAAGVASLGVFPKIVSSIAMLLGISYPPVLPIVFGLCLILVKTLLMDIERSKNEVKLHRLAQHIALLETEIKLIIQNNKNKDKT